MIIHGLGGGGRLERRDISFHLHFSHLGGYWLVGDVVLYLLSLTKCFQGKVFCPNDTEGIEGDCELPNRLTSRRYDKFIA